jgi:hypothetical protein
MPVPKDDIPIVTVLAHAIVIHGGTHEIDN